MIREIDPHEHPQCINIQPLGANPTLSPRLFFSPLKADGPLKVNKVAFSSHLRMDHSLGAPLVSCVVWSQWISRNQAVLLMLIWDNLTGLV